MRFERKYRIEGKSIAMVKQLLRFHPAGFRTLYPDRQINNIYFDTGDMTTFTQNVYGINERKKYRLRWYGEDLQEILNSQFEIKIKHNELGEKETHDFPDSRLKDLSRITRHASRILTPALPLRPVLLNSYNRSYFGSMDGKFRLTIDVDLRYHSLLVSPAFRKYLIRDDAIIVEVKYDETVDQEVEFITQHMPFRQGKHSKYVNGVFMTN